jgi:hypothetical protein
MSKSNADQIGRLELFIEEAKLSVDLAMYDLGHPRIGKALALLILSKLSSIGIATGCLPILSSSKI